MAYKESKESKESKDNMLKDNMLKDNILPITDVNVQFGVSNLTISTCTVITNLNTKINLGYLSRFVNIYNQNSDELNLKAGGIYNLEFYGNCARGETLVDKIKDEFNNQATIKFKYWGFRNINVKVFANGKLQMTGLKYENEAIEIGNLLIDIIKNTKINILSDINELINIPKTFDLQIVYNAKTNQMFYYRKYYDRFLKNYNFDINTIYTEHKNTINKGKQDIQDAQSIESNDTKQGANTKQSADIKDKYKEYSFNIKRKNFKKGIHDAYYDIIEQNNKEILKNNEWYGDDDIMIIIDKIELIKSLFEKEMENLLSISTTLINVKDNIEKISHKYQDFKFDELDDILNNINKNIYSNDEHTLVDIKSEIYQFNKLYRNLLEKKINRLVIIRNIDVSICYNLEKYLATGNQSIGNQSIGNLDKLKNISLETLDLITGEITESHNYHVSNTTTVLINSDLSVNFNINLKKLSKILKKKGLFNTYEPDEHSGINLKYYYNSVNETQGFCNCQPHCATKEKHSICTKITLLIFRPGSIIITGSRNLEQLKAAHALILKIMEENMHLVKMDEHDDNKSIALLNNEFRKISKKPRLFYIKKTNLIFA